MNIKVDNKKVVLITIGVVALLAGLFGATYAYFSAEVINPNGSSMNVETANLGKVTFTDGPEILLEDMYPGTDEYKMFTVERSEATVNDTVVYDIILNVRSNTLTDVADGEFVYLIYGATEGLGSPVLSDRIEVPTETTTLGTGSLVGNELHTYIFQISFDETGSNQNSTRGKGFNGYLQVEIKSDVSALAPTNTNCFIFYDTGIVGGYLDYQGGNTSLPACPKDVVIGSNMYGYTTTSIHDMAFLSKNLTSVVIPDTVTSIGYAAFVDNQFSDEDAFIYARTDINSDGVAEIDNTKLNSYGGSKRSGVVIPSNVEILELGAMAMSSLTSVTIPNSVTSIGDSALYGNLLTSVTIPSSVMSIDMSAFSSNELTSVCIKGKSDSSEFSLYGDYIWGWADGYDDSNIIWNCTN